MPSDVAGELHASARGGLHGKEENQSPSAVSHRIYGTLPALFTASAECASKPQLCREVSDRERSVPGGFGLRIGFPALRERGALEGSPQVLIA